MSRIYPLIMIPAEMEPTLLCVGVKMPHKTVMFFNQDAEINDAPLVEHSGSYTRWLGQPSVGQPRGSQAHVEDGTQPLDQEGNLRHA